MKSVLMAATMALAMTVAMAADDEAVWHAGAAASFGEYTFDTGKVEDSTIGLRLFSGYRFNRSFGVEGAYHNTGDFEEDLQPLLPTGTAEISLDGFSLSGLLFAPLPSDDVDIYGKLGYFSFDQELVVDNAVSQSNSPDGLLAGIGARIAVSDNVAVRVSGDWFDVDKGDLWAVNLGAEYLFGRKAAPAEAPAPEPAAQPAPEPMAAAEPAPQPEPPAAPADSDGDGVADGADDCADTPEGATVDDRGCEVEIVLRGVTFEYDSSELTAESTTQLDAVAETLKKRGQFNVEVAGHTDSIGPDEYNQDLSDRRANAVRDYLIERGVDAGQLTAVGYGESQPVAPNETADGRDQNRRVSLEFTSRDAG